MNAKNHWSKYNVQDTVTYRDMTHARPRLRHQMCEIDETIHKIWNFNYHAYLVNFMLLGMLS